MMQTTCVKVIDVLLVHEAVQEPKNASTLLLLILADMSTVVMITHPSSLLFTPGVDVHRRHCHICGSPADTGRLSQSGAAAGGQQGRGARQVAGSASTAPAGHSSDT